MESKLIAELVTDALGPGYVPAEQIAAVAVNEIRQGHGFDAAVLLSLASYRYFQQGIHVINTADYNVPYNVNRAVYHKFVHSELEVFLNLDFSDEMKFLFARLDYDEKLAKQYAEGRWKLFGVDEDNRAALSRKLIKSIEASYTAPSEHLVSPALADAFLRRLTQDTRSKTHGSTASYLMSLTPLRRYQLAALRHSSIHFNVPLCKRMARRLAVYRNEVLASLQSERPTERSNAAMILGLNPSDENLAALESAYAREGDAGTKLSMEYALIRHGRGDERRLFTGITSCKEEQGCKHAIHLVQWLPPEIEARVSPDLMVTILKDLEAPNFSRVFAAVILGNIAHQITLEKQHVRALLLASADKSEEVAEQAALAIRYMPQLDRPAAVDLLRNTLGRYAVYMRLAEIATPSELPLVRRAMTSFAQKQGPEQKAVLMLLANIKGPEATELLTEFFKEFPAHRFLIACVLVDRGDSRYNTLNELSTLDDSTGALALKIGARHSEIESSARMLLKGGDMRERLETLQLLGRYELTRLLPEVDTLFSYANSVYYPGDAYVRYTALSLMLFYEIQRSKKIGRIVEVPTGDRTKFRDGT